MDRAKECRHFSHLQPLDFVFVRFAAVPIDAAACLEMSSALDLLLANTPALPPPAGVSSNFNCWNSLRDVTISSCAICLFLAILAVAARTITRVVVHKSMRWEDCK